VNVGANNMGHWLAQSVAQMVARVSYK
jgi:hypothetical protein